MRAPRCSFYRCLPACSLSILLAGAVLVLAGRMAAQNESAPPAATPPAGSTADVNGGTTLFPSSGVAAPELEENRAANRAARHGRRGAGRGNGPAQAGRSNDVLANRAASDPVSVRIAYRKVKTQVLLRHPELASLERQAAASSTDTEKRTYLRAYYTQLYSAVKKMDPSPEMVSHIDLLSRIAEQCYDPKRRAVGGDEDLVRGGRGGRGRRR